jgi:hypothetical protein
VEKEIEEIDQLSSLHQSEGFVNLRSLKKHQNLKTIIEMTKEQNLEDK